MAIRARARAFADDKADDKAAEDAPSEEPDYNFEGFNVEFSEKVALTPPTAKGQVATNG